MNWLKQQVAYVAGTAEPIYGPEALQSVAKEAEETPFTELTKDDLHWTAMESTSVETQTFYFMADSGHIGSAQVIYSNVAIFKSLANARACFRGIRTTAYFNTKIFYPDETKPPLWSSDYLEGLGFDESRLCFYADACALDLSEDGTFYTIKSANNEESLVNLKVTRTAPGFVVGKDGKTFYGTDPVNPWGTMWHKFWPRCTVEGEVVTKDGDIDFKGKGLFIHALQGMKPHHAAAKWNFMNFQSPNYSAVMMEFTTPPSYGSSVVNVGGIAVDGEILMAGANHTYEQTEKKDDPDWPEPSAVRLLWHGKTKDGKPVEAELSGGLKRLDKVDIMAEVPGFVKTIVGGLVGTRPFVFQYVPQEQMKIKIKIDGEEKVEDGTVFCESTFISE